MLNVRSKVETLRAGWGTSYPRAEFTKEQLIALLLEVQADALESARGPESGCGAPGAGLRSAEEWLAVRGSCTHSNCDICESHKRLYRDIQADALEAAAQVAGELHWIELPLPIRLDTNVVQQAIRALKPEKSR